MPQTIIFLGLALCGQTVAALFLSTQKYPGEFLPMMLGIPTLFAGVVALNPHRRFHLAWLLGAVAACCGLVELLRFGMLVRRTSLDLPVSPLSWWMAAVLISMCAAVFLVCFAMARSSLKSGRRMAVDGVQVGLSDAISATPQDDSSVQSVVLPTLRTDTSVNAASPATQAAAK